MHSPSAVNVALDRTNRQLSIFVVYDFGAVNFVQCPVPIGSLEGWDAIIAGSSKDTWRIILGGGR